MTQHATRSSLTLWLIGLFLCLLVASPALAVCTSDLSHAVAANTGGSVVSAIVTDITVILSSTSSQLYEAIIGNPKYRMALGAILLLSTSLYGAMILFDLVQLHPKELIMRVIKIGIIVWVAMPGPAGGWLFIQSIVVKFFLGTMTELVNLFLKAAAIATLATNLGVDPEIASYLVNLGEPLGIFNDPIKQLFSVKFGTTMKGLMTMGPTGILMAGILAWAAFNLMMFIFQAIFVYVKCIVALWFLISLAPIFFVFIMFQKTRPLFEGWLNMIVNFALQPVLLFAFCAFYVVMIIESLKKMMMIEWCEVPLQLISGLPITFNAFRPSQIPVSNGSGGFTMTSVPEGGAGSWQAHGLQGYPEFQFPIDMMDVMFLMLASYLGMQYGKMVPSLASRLADGGISLGANMDNVQQFMSSRGMSGVQTGIKGLAKGLEKGYQISRSTIGNRTASK
jgi:type IV secretory pathway VirB6-like protein